MAKVYRYPLICLICICCILFSLVQNDHFFTFFSNLSQTDQSFIFWKLRLPRTLTAFVSGALLALAGTLMQLLLQNPLADPYALGISSGAALTTLLFMYFGVPLEFLIFGAWGGSLFSIALILALASQHKFQSYALLLCGVAIAYALSALISLILLLSSDATLHSMLFWLAGDLNEAQMPYLEGTILITGTLICLGLAPGLNILSRGEISAKTLGLRVKLYQIFLFLLSSLFTAAAVSISGCIGFIGLLVPHLTRALIAFDYRYILPLNVLLGGSLLVFADTVARTILSPQQIPVGIITALFGLPIYLWLLRQ